MTQFLKQHRTGLVILIVVLAGISLCVWSVYGQQKPRRLITCRVVDVQEVFPPEAQLVINDTVLIHVACRNHPRLEIPAYKWPEEWGGIQIGKRVRFIDFGDGKRWLPVRTASR